MPMVRSILTVSLFALGLAACGHRMPAMPGEAAPSLKTITVSAGGEAGGLTWDGVVQAVEQAVLSAQTTGRVTGLQADVDQRVARGAVLVRLTADEQDAAVRTAQAQLRAAEAQLVDAASRLQRAQGLVGRQLISRDEFDRVKAAHDSTQANRDAAAAHEAQVSQQLAYTVVRAPYAGIVSARHVEQGETVAPGQPLFTLYAPGQLRLEVQLPQGDAEAIRRDSRAVVMLVDGRELKAARVIVYPGADPLAHSTTVRVILPHLDNPPRPGETAKVRFTGAGGPAGFWLPASALVLRSELAAAYVVREDGVVLRQLRLGRRMGDRVEVISGLTAGERVAADPLAALQFLRERHAASGTGHG